MARGGNRGGGRPPGSTNYRKALEVRRILDEVGLTPFYVMMINMKKAYEQALALEATALPAEKSKRIEREMNIWSLRSKAQGFAVDAAPYCHPKVANIQHSNDPDNPLPENNLQVIFVNSKDLPKANGKVIENGSAN